MVEHKTGFILINNVISNVIIIRVEHSYSDFGAVEGIEGFGRGDTYNPVTNTYAKVEPLLEASSQELQEVLASITNED
jgi:hypothetical protein